jgi:hypothetical protein
MIEFFLRILIGRQLFNKFPELYGIRSFISVFTLPHTDSILSQLNPVRTFSRYLFKIYLLFAPIYVEIHQAFSFLQAFPPKYHMHLPATLMCYMISPSHPA